MQKFTNLTPDMKLKDSRIPLVDNDLTIASHYAAGSFPTQNLVVGMECYRTDLGSKYRLASADPVRWEPVLIPAEIAKIKVNNAGHADTAASSTTAASCTGNAATATRANSADSCTGNAATATKATSAQTASACTGNAATATKLQTARTINGVAFDGTKNITVDAGISTNSNITVTGSTETAWSDNVRISADNDYGNGVLRIGGNTLTRVAGVAAGTYTLQSLLQQLVTKSHTHGAIAASGVGNCNCDCCNCGGE